jgi:hypothetical protein
MDMETGGERVEAATPAAQAKRLLLASKRPVVRDPYSTGRQVQFHDFCAFCSVTLGAAK